MTHEQEPCTLDEVFDLAGALVTLAADRGLVSRWRIALAGAGVQIQVVGPRLSPLFEAAFAHLAAARAGPRDLVVTVIDGALPESSRLAGSCGFAMAADGTLATGTPRALDFGDTCRVILDLERGRGLQWVPDVSAIPAWAAASPLRSTLAWFLRSRDRYLVHGAAIGHAAGAVLLGARGGSGKSTCALACLAAHERASAPRLLVAGDDFVVLEPDPVAPRVHALLATARLERTHFERFPGLARFIAGPGSPLDFPSDKAVLCLFPGAAERLAPVLTLRAIAVPELDLDRPESRFFPIPRHVALRAVAPSSIYLVPGAGAETLSAITRLVAALPTYRLAIGSDPQAIPDAVAALIAHAEAARA